MNDDLKDDLQNLTNAINELTAIQNDIFKTDSSHDDIVSLKGRISDLVESNKELNKSIGYLNAAINNLADNIKR